MGRPDAGITLIELMVTVAIVGILAAVAVFAYGKYTKKARASEVYEVFGEFRLRQEQHHVENSEYLATGADETDYFPLPVSADDPHSIATPPAEWTTLKINIGKPALYCGYVAIAGDGGDATNIGGTANAFGMTAAPADDWFYVLAECPFNGRRYMIRSDSDLVAQDDY
jgi:prepilin-type N-terminal cleavage/methylation domain-containing protein